MSESRTTLRFGYMACLNFGNRTRTCDFIFDNMGRLTNTTTSCAFLTGRNFTTSYGYDAALNRTVFTDPENGATSYAYDTLNRLQTLTPPSAQRDRFVRLEL